MPTIQDIYVNAILADASYVNLDPGTALASDANLSTRMTPKLAALIASNFTVLTSVTSPGIMGSGFDATVWKGRAGTAYAGKVYISMRGTQQGTDFLNDADLALGGLAGNQVVDMINWWFKVTTRREDQASQIGVVAHAVGVDPNGATIYEYQLGEAPPVAGTGEVLVADIAGGVFVNGHSLGGYLASAFHRLLGVRANVLHTSTFNSLGFAPGSELEFAALEAQLGPGFGRGRLPTAAEQSNYFATHGVSFATNSLWFGQAGQRVEVFNEFSSAQIPNHSMYKLTDSLALALANAMSRLDPSMTLARANALLEAGSTQVRADIERTLDGLRRAPTLRSVGYSSFASNQSSWRATA